MDCIACRHNDLSDAQFSVGNRFPLLKCSYCGLHCLDFSLGERLEEEEYWSDLNKKIYSDVSVTSAIDKKYGKYLPQTSLSQERGGGKLLDVGCGIGNFLEVAENKGFEVFGVEPSKLAVELARKRWGNIICGLLTISTALPRNFQVVTAWDVIEHVNEPEDFLKIIHKRLCKGGTLLLETPDQGCFLRKIVHFMAPAMKTLGYKKDIKRNLYYHAHRFYFTHKGMALLLRRIGFYNIKFHKDLTLFEKSILKLKYQRGYSDKRLLLNKALYLLMKKLPIIFSNKMVVQATKQ